MMTSPVALTDGAQTISAAPARGLFGIKEDAGTAPDATFSLDMGEEFGPG